MKRGSILAAVSILKAPLLIAIVPFYLNHFFAPFLVESFQFGVDPWKHWLSMGGNAAAFPYGLPMYALFTPAILISKLLASFGLSAPNILVFLMVIEIFALDVYLGLLVSKTKISTMAFVLYLISPVVIWVNYFLGHLDIFPAFLIVISFSLLNKKRPLAAGVVLGAAIGMKFSFILVIPFLIVFVFDNPRIKSSIYKFISMSLLISVLSYAPAIWSESFRAMVLQTPESKKVFAYYLYIGGAKLLLLPTIYLLLLYWLRRAGRTSINVLMTFTAIALSAVALVTPSSPGWMLWGLPLLLLTLKMSLIDLGILTFLQLCALNLYGLEVSQQITGRFFSPITIKLGWYPNVTFTLMLVIGGLYVARILRQAVLQGDIYKMAQKPFQISIAGDSGVGKDTLASGLVEIFGRDNSVLISGDNYHKYERDDHVWGKITHLNPEANNISKWSNDLQNASNRTTFSQRYYDHEFGKFTDDMHHTKADLVVSQGLHGLYPELTLNSDVCVYLEMEEKLRVALKIARDSGSRQRTVAEVRRQLRQRGEDASRYISTQVLSADLHVILSQASVKGGEYFVDLRFSNSVQFEEFSKAIVHFSNVEVHEIVDSTGRKWLRVKSEEFNSDEAISLLQSTMKDFNQIFPRFPHFPSGSEGVICTAVLFLVDRKR